MLENDNPIITGKTAGTLKIPENSLVGTAVDGGFVTCNDKEVNRICVTADNTECAKNEDIDGNAIPNLSLTEKEDKCKVKPNCEWKSNTCACRRQQLEFFALVNTTGINFGLVKEHTEKNPEKHT